LFAVPYIVEDEQDTRPLIEEAAEVGAGQGGVVELRGIAGDEPGDSATFAASAARPRTSRPMVTV
jgi:hypothetical protein